MAWSMKGTYFKSCNCDRDPRIVPIDFEVEGRTGTIKVGDTMENSFAPIKNPITGDEETVRIAIPGGLEYSRGDGLAEILASSTLRSTDEIAFDHTGSRTSLVSAQDRGSDRSASPGPRRVVERGSKLHINEPVEADKSPLARPAASPSPTAR